MTPEQFLARVAALVAAGKEQEALDAAHATGPEVRPALTADQFARLGGMLEGAAMSVNLTEAGAQRTAKVARAS